MMSMSLTVTIYLPFSCGVRLFGQLGLLAALSLTGLCFRRQQQKSISHYLLCPVHWWGNSLHRAPVVKYLWQNQCITELLHQCNTVLTKVSKKTSNTAVLNSSCCAARVHHFLKIAKIRSKIF